jgi:hypothetical protein
MTAPAQTRRRLPNRRGHELLSFKHGRIHYTAGVGLRVVPREITARRLGKSIIAGFYQGVCI